MEHRPAVEKADLWSCEACGHLCLGYSQEGQSGQVEALGGMSRAAAVHLREEEGVAGEVVPRR
jgi:hypothetical protein